MAGINRTTGKATDLITFSRASGGTALRKISYGSELVTNGTFDTDTDWVKTNYVISGGAASTISSATNPALSQSLAGLTEGAIYEVRYTASVDSGSAGLFPNLGTIGNPTALSRTISNTTPTEYSFVTVAGPTGVLKFTNTTTASVLTLDNISVKEVLFDQPDGTLTLFNHPDNIPRIEYAADGTVKGLLIEEARTNLVTYSEDFTNAAWVKTGITVTANSSTAPDGSMTADLLTSNGSGTNRARFSTAVSGAHSYSIFAKAGTGSFIQILDGASVNYFANFDIGAGVVGGKGSLVTSSISDVGNGWYRCTMSTDGSVAGVNFNIYIVDNASAAYGSSSTSPDTVYVYGAQLEAGSFPTSYIPTSGATATRAADIASISVDNFGYRQDAGTVVVDVNTFDTDYSNWVWVLDGTSDTSLYAHSAANGWRVFGSGGTVAYLGSLPANADAKIGYAYSNAGSAALIDGGSVTAAAHSQPVAVTTIRLGAVSASSTFLNGHIKSIQYLPRRLSNAQLQALTA
jgi:hypothetical protein